MISSAVTVRFCATVPSLDHSHSRTAMSEGVLKISLSRCGPAISQARMNPTLTMMRPASPMLRRLRAAAIPGAMMPSMLSSMLAIGVLRGIGQRPQLLVNFLESGLEADLHRVARPLQADRYIALDPSRPARHDDDAVRKRDRFFQIMGHEHHGLALAFPQAHQLALQLQFQ